MPLCLRLAVRSMVLSSVAVALIGLSPASSLASATYWVGASTDLAALDIPMIQVTGGYTSPPDANGTSHWWFTASKQNPYTISIGGVALGEITNWTADLNGDPFVTNNINFTNNTAFTTVYNASVLMPLSPAFSYTAVINSSVGVTATDDDADNQMLVDRDSGIPFYQGRVNSVTLLSLLNPGSLPITTASCTIPGPNSPGCTATTSDGTTFLSTAGTANNIEILLHFVLSPGDSIGITSRFEIVPEPSTSLLVGLGLVGLGIERRRRAR